MASTAPDHQIGCGSDPIYVELKERILTGEIPGDTPLRQDDLAAQFGVSKIPVREALRRLEAEGLVTFRARRGAAVRKFSETDILQLMDIRVALECRALELAIPNMISTDFTVAGDLLNDYAAGANLAAWSDMNLRFHGVLYEPCGNPELMNMISGLQQKLGKFLRLLVTEASGLERPIREHAEILAACEQGDVDRAVSTLKTHIGTTKKEVAAFMRRRTQES
ncbi:MAG: GntR family transcriptional regulator [Geminicoccales bacterium]